MNTLIKHLIASSCVLALSGTAMADALLVDRGLPTANLNLDTGDRSNVAWVDGGQAAGATPRDYWLEGDTFSNTSGAAWQISTIRVWTVGDTGTVSLLGGLSSLGAAGIGALSSTYTATNTSYAGGALYTAQDGTTRTITQIDFAVNITLAAGDDFSFYLDGTGGKYVVPFMSAANSQLAGSPQDGADGLIWEANFVGGSAVSVDSFSTAPPNGWDKGSDFNVQVFGNAVPEPASVALVGVALLGLAAARRRRG